MSHRVGRGILWLKFTISILASIYAVKFIFSFGAPDPGKKVAETVVLFVACSFVFGALAFLFGWLTGKVKTPQSAAPIPTRGNGRESKSVYDEPPQIATNAGATAAPLAGGVTEECWARALGEYESESRRPGLWAKSFAEARGDESVAKANYLRYRALELENESSPPDRNGAIELARSSTRALRDHAATPNVVTATEENTEEPPPTSSYKRKIYSTLAFLLLVWLLVSALVFLTGRETNQPTAQDTPPWERDYQNAKEVKEAARTQSKRDLAPWERRYEQPSKPVELNMKDGGQK